MALGANVPEVPKVGNHMSPLVANQCTNTDKCFGIDIAKYGAPYLVWYVFKVGHEENNEDLHLSTLTNWTTQSSLFLVTVYWVKSGLFGVSSQIVQPREEMKSNGHRLHHRIFRTIFGITGLFVYDEVILCFFL